ncbi:hypothetical protein TNCV_2758361 [Trichonephila clavipes]|nr:hypothetical protein TNCV_2758361 [Trichonephila clavipes]
MDVCKCIVPLRHGGTLNSRRAASSFVWLVDGVERWEAHDRPQVSSLKFGVETSEIVLSPIVRVQYFVRGGFVRHRSRASSKHLSPHLPVYELDSSGGQTGVRCTCRCTCGCRVHKESQLDVDVFEK